MSQPFGSEGYGGVGLPERDLDRLADFLAGALDAAQMTDVAHLVASDARWAGAAAALRRADVAVRDDLRVAAAESPMPADVAARLESAIRAAGGAAGAPRHIAHGAVRAGGGAWAGRSRAAPTGATRTRGRQSGRRSWGSWAGLAAAAASVVAVVGGIAVTTQLTAARDTSTASGGYANPEAGDRGAAPPPSAPAEALFGAPSFMISGADYRPETLSQLGRSAPAASAAPTDNASKGFDAAEIPPKVRDSAPAGLARLTDPAALAACLHAVLAAYPGRVAVVDYARFAGQPALVILLRQGPTSAVVAVGPGCGVAGADEKASAQIS